jgi:squalene cyclase
MPPVSVAAYYTVYTTSISRAYTVSLFIHTQHLGEGGSGVVQTAWALLGLLAGGCTDKAALDRGRDFLMRRQLPTGDWAQEGITGVFNRSCGITYTAYRNLFPMWALARYAAIYESADE